MTIKKRIEKIETKVSSNARTESKLKDDSEMIADAERRVVDMFNQQESNVRRIR